MKSYDLERIPAWYELSVRDEKTLRISVPREVYRWLCAITWEKSFTVLSAIQKFGLPDFIPPNNMAWGFDGSLTRVSVRRKGWVSWDFHLPIQVRTTYGVENHRLSIALRCSLLALFSSLWIFEDETTSPEPQLLTIDQIIVAENMNGGALSATLTPPLCEWISTQDGWKLCEELAEAMNKTYAYLHRAKRYDECSVQYKSPDQLYFHVPGNACDLAPNSWRFSNDGSGYELSPHNIDSSLQQFLFLIGLAKLHDLARKEQSP